MLTRGSLLSGRRWRCERWISGHIDCSTVLAAMPLWLGFITCVWGERTDHMEKKINSKCNQKYGNHQTHKAYSNLDVCRRPGGSVGKMVDCLFARRIGPIAWVSNSEPNQIYRRFRCPVVSTHFFTDYLCFSWCFKRTRHRRMKVIRVGVIRTGIQRSVTKR